MVIIMKNIFLVGDSIRFGASKSPGYGCIVKEMLDGVANVYAPDVNCQFTVYTLRQMHNWAAKVDAEKIDIVHWNNGLWDVAHWSSEPDNVVPIHLYKYYLERIYNRIKFCFPNAKIIFALTTPVQEDKQGESYFRRNSEIEEYNAAATEVITRLGGEINDLYSVVKQHGSEIYSDMVHYNDEGCKILAKAVIDKLGL